MHMYPKRASLDGLEAEIFKLVSYSATPEQWKEWLRVPLEHAAARGNLDLFNKLLGAGADGSAGWRGCRDRTMLDAAAVAIAEHGVDVNASDVRHGETALYKAAGDDQPDAVATLIEAGADVTLKTRDGGTPFAIAAFESRCKSTLVLLQHGAKIDVQDYDGDTPLHLACRGCKHGLEAAVDLLLRWGADETAVNNDDRSPAELLDSNRGWNDRSATQDEIERTRLLLSRAPADRAWRRRGWLVMLRSRAERASLDGGRGNYSGINLEGDRPSDGDGERDGEGGEATRRDEEGRAADRVVRRMTSTDGGASGGRSEDGVLRGVVGLLVGTGPKSVFRTIVGYM
eukprot:g7194.t1